MTIGNKIKKLRKQKNLTQLELAKLIGCAQNTIADWENGKTSGPGNKFINSISRVLGVSSEELLSSNEIGNKNNKITCIATISTSTFLLAKEKYPIEIPTSEYKQNRFAIKIKGNFLVPIAEDSNYCIFEEKAPEDNDILIYNMKNSVERYIKIWRQYGSIISISDVDVCSKERSIFADMKKNKYVEKESKKEIIIQGVLVAVKKIAKIESIHPKIKYIYT